MSSQSVFILGQFNTKPTLKQQYQLIKSYNLQQNTPTNSQIYYLQSFKQKLQKQIIKQQAILASNYKIIKNLETQIKQSVQSSGNRSLGQIQSEKEYISSEILQIRKEIKLLTSKGNEKKEDQGNNQNLQYQYQLQVKKNAEYKKKIQDLDRLNEQTRFLPPVKVNNSKSGQKSKKQVELAKSLSLAKSKAQKNQQVYLGNISGKQVKIMELQKNYHTLDKTILQIQQQIQEMKLIGL